jgi:hypothetical protein
MAWYPRQPLLGSAGKECGVLRLAPDGWGEYSDAGERKLGYALPDPVTGSPGPRVLISTLYPLVRAEAHVAADAYLVDEI